MSVADNSKVKEMRVSSEKMENENKKMEEYIYALKQMMSKEKDERIRNGGNRWKSSVVPTTMQKRVVKSDKNKIPGKVQVLTNEPISTYLIKERDVENGQTSLPCGQCEDINASLECMECCEKYCSNCFKNFHARGALRKHTAKAVHLSKHSIVLHESNTEVNRDARDNINVESTEPRENLSRQGGVNTSGKANRKGGSLLVGTYDERESAAYFAEALENWRKGGGNSEKTQRTKNIVESRSCGTAAPWTSRTARISSPSEVKLNFGSSLTYADRLALKKSKKDSAAYIGYRYPAQKRSLELDRKLLGSPSSSSTSGNSPKIERNRASNPVSPASAASYTSLKCKRKGQRASPSSSKGDEQQKKVLSIHQVPSLEDIRGSADLDGNDSPVVEYNSNDESSERKEARQTLSQMGRLTIVELNFSDAEPELSGNDQRRSKSATVMLSPSNTPSPQSSKGSSSPRLSKTSLTPRPPNHSASEVQNPRRKIFGVRQKQKSKQKEAEAVKAGSPRKVWASPPVYRGLDDFFMVGVDNDEEHNVEVEKDPTAKTRSDDTKLIQSQLLGLSGNASLWRPDSSLANEAEGGLRRDSGFKSEETVHLREPLPEVTMTVESPDGSLMVDRGIGEPHTDSLHPFLYTTELYEEPQDPKFLKSISALSSPRISLSDYDFLKAPPPMSKGDNFTKIHRASTVTIFGLSPQPPDLWNDDSEIELSGLSPRRGTSPFVFDNVDEDRLALEELASEFEVKGKSYREAYRGDQYNLPFWEEEDLSIEDKDDGSGLSSPAETDIHYEGDESSDDEKFKDKQIVLDLM